MLHSFFKENDATGGWKFVKPISFTNMIPKKELLELAEARQPLCVSIFIPTHRTGRETLKGEDSLLLKNQLKEVKLQLEGRGMNVADSEAFLKPAQELIENSEFWRHQSDGLAIFIAGNFFRKYSVPLYFEEYGYVSDEFYLKPLMPLFNGDGLFYLLALKMDEVKFYKGTRYSIAEIELSDRVPSRLEDVAGYDYEQKGLQFRTQPGNRGGGMFHGHGEEADAKMKNELLRYFRAVNNGILPLLPANHTPPLVLECLPFHFSIYQEVNTYRNLFSQPISRNSAEVDVLLLHEKAWGILQDYFDQHRREKIQQFLQWQGTGKTSSGIREILPEAFRGKVDALFLEKQADIFGTYHRETFEVELDEEHIATNISLLNLLAIKVFEQGGAVFLMEKEDMPDTSSPINALYRY